MILLINPNWNAANLLPICYIYVDSIIKSKPAAAVTVKKTNWIVVQLSTLDRIICLLYWQWSAIARKYIIYTAMYRNILLIPCVVWASSQVMDPAHGFGHTPASLHHRLSDEPLTVSALQTWLSSYRPAFKDTAFSPFRRVFLSFLNIELNVAHLFQLLSYEETLEHASEQCD